MKPETRERIIRRRRQVLQFWRRHVWVLWGASLLWSVLAAILAVRGYPWIAALYVTCVVLTLDLIATVNRER